MSNYIRLIIAGLIFVGSILLFVFGRWGWGIGALLLMLPVVLTFFFNENMLMAQYFLRKEKMEQAALWLGKIHNFQKQLFRAQHGYYHLLLGMLESQHNPLKSEKFFKKALALGMTMDHNIALAKLSLAGVAMAKRNKREAIMYLEEAKKADKNKLLTEQIKMMKAQMGQLDRTVQKRGYR